jgi:hypothetical protein
LRILFYSHSKILGGSIHPGIIKSSGGSSEYRKKKERKYIYLTAHLSKYIKKRNDNTKVKKKKK